MKKFFKWLLVLLVILVVSLVILVNFPGLIKGPVERKLSDIAGYQINLEGELDLDLGRQIRVSAKNVNVSGPDWATQRNLIEIGHLDLSLATGALFEDIIVVDSLEVDSLRLNLETNAEGKGNWLSANAPAAPREEDEEDKKNTPVIFSNVEVSSTALSFQNGKTGVKNVLNIDSLKHHQQSDGMMQATLIGNLNERPVEYVGKIGPYENLLNGKDISYDASGHFGDLTISSDGHIDDLLEPRRPRFNLEMQGPNIDEITAMLGVDDLGSGGFTLRAEGAGVTDLYEASINGRVGDVSLNASARVSDLSELDDLDLKLAANGPSLGSVTRVFGVEDWPDKPFSLKGDVDRVGGTLNISGLTLNIGGTEIILDALFTSFPKLDASRVKLTVEGDDIVQFRELLGLPGVADGPFKIHGKLDVSTDQVELLHVNLETTLGQATLSGTLGQAPGYTGSKLQLHLDGHNAHSLMSVFGIDALPEEPFNLNARVELIDNGLRIERGVLVTIEDDRLELGGLITFNPGIAGSEFDLRVSGNDLAQMLQHVMDTGYIPTRPYDLNGHLEILESSLNLEDMKLDFEGVRLATTGSINFDDQLLGSSLNFQINGDDFSTLRNFEVIGGSLDIFVPGQAYGASGLLTFETNGWKLKDISGQIGATDFDMNSLISNQNQLAGSNISFSIKGPGLNQLLVDQDGFLPDGAYQTNGQILLAEDRLSIQKFNIATDKSQGEFVLDIGWPISDSLDVDFDLKLQGRDIRDVLPDMSPFKPNSAEFDMKIIGEQRGKMISLERFFANIGNLQINTIGEIGRDPGGEKMVIAFSLESRDISRLGQIDDEPLPALPMDVKAEFSGNFQEFVVQNFDVSLGESGLEGRVDVSLTGSKPDIRLLANSRKVDLRPFIDPAVADEAEVVDDDTEPEQRERLIPATPLPLDVLAAADILLKLNIAEVQYWKASTKNLVLHVEVKAGNLDVQEFSFDAPNGKLRTSLTVRPTSADQADVSIDMDAKELVLNLSGLSEENLQLVPKLNLDFQITGKGGNLQELAGSSNGSFDLESSGGTLVGVDMSILEIFILDEIFSLIMPKSSQSSDTELTCVATILNIEDGVVKTDPGLAFTTDQVAIISKGTLDLKTEKMKFNFNATPTNALKISAGELFNPYILVGGTLSKPDVGIDPGKAILHGGAAVGTAGISILAKGLLDRVGNVMPLCEQMRDTVRQKE